MVDVRIEGDRVVFEVEGWDKMWALKSRLEIPLSHIKGAKSVPYKEKSAKDVEFDPKEDSFELAKLRQPKTRR